MFKTKFNKKGLYSILAVIMMLVMVFSSCQSTKKDNDTDTDGTSSFANVPEGVDINYVMNYLSEDLTPYLTLGQYKDYSVTVNSYEINDEYVTKQLELFMQEYTYPSKITDRKTKDGDVINVDYSGSHNGEKFAGGTAANQTITLSDDNGYIPGFADGMYDVMPGETVTYDVTFPEEYPNNPDLAGQKTTFTVTVNYIEGEKITPEFNDAFVAENFAEQDLKTTKDFMEYYRGYLEDQRTKSIRSDASGKIWTQILGNVTLIGYPEKAVESLYWMYRSSYQDYAKQYGVSYDEFLRTYVQTDDAGVMQYAKDYIKEDLVIYSIVKAEGIEITDEEYKEGIEYYCEYYGQTEEELLATYPKEQIMSVLQWNKLMDCIYDWSNVEITYEAGEESQS